MIIRRLKDPTEESKMIPTKAIAEDVKMLKRIEKTAFSKNLRLCPRNSRRVNP